MSGKYVVPTLNAGRFTCPMCGTLAQQLWKEVWKGFSYSQETTDLRYSLCLSCDGEALWKGNSLLLPSGGTEPPHELLPVDLKSDYEEAANVASSSPRSAAALLRVCVQKLCKELGGKGENINEDVAYLVTLGLPVKIQQALDVLRVVGNEQVHPGVLDVRDDPSIVAALFRFINLIVENRVAEPKHVQDVYDMLPASKKAAIEQRDKGSATTNA